jgi:hypothetical protein
MGSGTSTTAANGTNSATSTTGDATATASGTDSTSTSAFGSTNNGQTFGGGGIIGFSPNSPKQSILVYKTKNHYNEWEFVYDPLAEQMMQGGNSGTIGQPVANPATTFGGSSTIGGSTTAPTQNQTPQSPVTPQ